MTAAPKPAVLMILDGFGYSESPDSNAIMAANTPVWDRLWANAPRTLISGSGMDVGLPDGQMGNSEVGHMNLGAGRVVYQDFTRVTKAIADGEFFDNQAICAAVDQAVSAGRAEQIQVHAFLDGRDTPPRSAEPSLDLLEQAYQRLGKGRTASLIGRYFAMDRDNRWDRVEAAYNLITEGQGLYRADSAAEGLKA